ncbi:AAA family ATPase [Microbacterium sp. CH12i]|uniref:AAA family ATPase n=1 Tax=Microbacterium sp. CH12i TaxID=1479651 RepID=UPI000B0C4726|nr:AAA family ATPase [Microbacterium sp. CH12i]
MRSRLIARAWDHERPSKKPARLGSEAGWLRELEEAGYTPHPKRARVRTPVALDDLSVQQLASRALDRCAVGASTWTVHTIQEHVTRVITETGVRATPTELRDFVALATALAAEDSLSVLPPKAARPEHFAHLTSLHVVSVETRLHDLLAVRAASSDRVPASVADDHGLDIEQVRAAAGIASTNPLVVVEGAAGAGKTTMLGAAIETAAADGRATRIVTPTKKAADVAAKEFGISAESVAMLVHEHGWRWNRDGIWSRLTPGGTDPETGITYVGPSAEARLMRGERIVVDEAGMLDQDTALALLAVADEHGATLALVGDRAQLAAVGRGGVLDMAAQLSTHVVDLTTVHRFTDPEYADLTIRMRAGENAALLFDRLHALGLVALHNSTEDVRDAIASTTHVGDAITVATNDEARELNICIREERVRAGLVDDARTATGNDGLSFGRGDVIQTRRNDADVQVANRQTWTVQDVGEDGTVWAVENGIDRKRQRGVRLPAEYVAEHTHLTYASTAYGVQGATMPESHTVLGDALDAAGVYVGMTRGQEANRLHIVAADLDDAREQFTAALERDRADRGLVAATQAVRDAVAGFVAEGPVKLVSVERARLTEQIERADRQAAQWKRAAVMLSGQREEHLAESDEQRADLMAAEAQAERVRSEVTTPLLAQAVEDGTAYLAARQRMWDASADRRSARGFQRRGADRAQVRASTEHGELEAATTRRWGSTPGTTAGVPTWSASATGRIAENDPRVSQKRRQATIEQEKLHALQTRQGRERDVLRESIYGQVRIAGSAVTRADGWARQADEARRHLGQIEALPIDQAAALIGEHAEAQKADERAPAERAAQMREPEQRRSPSHGRGAERDGLSL